MGYSRAKMDDTDPQDAALNNALVQLRAMRKNLDFSPNGDAKSPMLTTIDAAIEAVSKELEG